VKSDDSGKKSGSGVDINRELEKMLLNQFEGPSYTVSAG
jgi:hypothetical protein